MSGECPVGKCLDPLRSAYCRRQQLSVRTAVTAAVRDGRNEMSRGLMIVDTRVRCTPAPIDVRVVAVTSLNNSSILSHRKKKQLHFILDFAINIGVYSVDQIMITERMVK